MMQGGLGDVLLAYLGKGRKAGYVKALREREPDAYVLCAILGTNPASAGVIDGFDGVMLQNWDSRPVEFETKLMREFEPIPMIGTWERPPLADISIKGNAIAVHPFAGGPARDWRGHIDSVRVIEALAETGRDVFVLGGSGPRFEGRHTVRELYLNESLEIPRYRNVINLIGAPTAMHVAIVAQCAHFVGAFSAYYCAAHATDRKTFVLTSGDIEPFTRIPRHPVFGGCLADRPGSMWRYFGRQSESDLIREMVEWTG